MSNGGVIGANNAATSTAAPGVWNIQDVYDARRNDTWPSLEVERAGLIKFVMANAVGGISGTVFSGINFLHPVGNTEGRFTADSATDTFTITTADVPPGHLLSVDDEVFFEAASGSDLPSPLVTGVVYYIHSVPSTTTFKLKNTIDGAALSISSNGTENANRKILKRPSSSEPKIDIEIFHYNAAAYPSGLNITTDFQVGANVDADLRLTCVVVDRDLTIGTGGTLRITNNRRRFGFLIASRQDVQIGPGTWTIPMFQNDLSAPVSERGHPNFRRWQLDDRLPYEQGFLVRGSNGGNGGPRRPQPFPYVFSNPSPGGGGGSSFGGAGGLAFDTSTPGNGTRGGGSGSSYNGGVGGPGGGNPGNENKMHNLAIVHARDVTIEGPGPTVRINCSGANGAAGVPFRGGGGGGGGGGSVYILHQGVYTNNGTISVAGGSGGAGGAANPYTPAAPGNPGAPGGTGTIVAAPVPGVL